jgi:DNA-binding response OmpR family regulator
LVRRNEFRRRNVLECGGLTLDVISLRTFRDGREIHLSQTEFRILELLVKNVGRVVSRHEILNTVWGPGRAVHENTLDAFVRLLRKKVDQDSQFSLIHTQRGFGYSIGPVSAE